MRNSGGRLDFVELFADQQTRLAREGTPLRTNHKRSKRAVGAARQLLLDADATHQLNTKGEFCYPDQHLRLDNGQRVNGPDEQAAVTPQRRARPELLLD